MATFGLGQSILALHFIATASFMRLLPSSKCWQCEGSVGNPPIAARYSCDVARQPHQHPAVASSRQQCRATGDPVALQVSRRELFQQTVLGAASLWAGTLAGGVLPPSAQAGLVSFPAADLKNTYWLVRAGEGQCEHDGYVLSNTVYKTSVSSGLSTDGKRQVVKKIWPALQQADACPDGICWLWPSITARSYQTAEILASTPLLNTGYRRIVPEYSFLDPRGVGALEGQTIEAATQQLQQGDMSSPRWRPPRGTDGTPNESSEDVLIRGRQVLSICETQWQYANVVIISPDSDNLSILQAAVRGVDLRRHRDFAFAPGDVRQLELAEESVAPTTSTFACRKPPSCM